MTEPADRTSDNSPETPETVVPINDGKQQTAAGANAQQPGQTGHLGQTGQTGQKTGQAETLNASDASSRVAVLEAEVATYKDQALRALAEAENTRRRAAKERDDAMKYGVTAFAKELVGVSDNLRRALDAAGAPADDKMRALIAGIEGTERQLQGAFDRAGIRKLEPLDQPFDPNFHRVMMEAENTGKAPGTVTQVLQAGYVIHDRLLREALVAIAKGEGSDRGAASSTLGAAINQQA